MNQTNCPDCNGELEQGTLLDFSYGKVLVQRYGKAILPQTKSLGFRAQETDFTDVRRVIAKRCTKCNRIFTYTQDFIVTPDLTAQNNKIMLIVMAIALLIVAIAVFGGLYAGLSGM